MSTFTDLYSINVNDKVEKKNGLSYLSWAFAWAELKKVYPDATYKVERFDGLFCAGNDQFGYMVMTSVTAGDITHEMWLPVMDIRNKSILKPTTFDVNKAIMRCLAKNISMFGLGLYIYAGEDLPEEDEKPQEKKVEKKQAEDKIVTPQIQAKNTEISHDNTKPYKSITREEIRDFYGIERVEDTIVFLEGKFGKEFAQWSDIETARARVMLQKKKEQKEAEMRSAGLQKVGGDVPFPKTKGDN